MLRITTFSVQMATSGVANQFQLHGLHIALSIVTYIISSGMSLFGLSVQRTNKETMPFLISNTAGGITTQIECSAMLSDANTKAANTGLSSHHVHPVFSLFRCIPCIVCDFPKPDLLHPMQMGMPDHLQKWIFHFVKTNEQLYKYNAIWLSVAAYHDLTPKNKSNAEVSEWNGKEMKEMSRYLLGAVTQSLQGGSPAQRPIFSVRNGSR